MEFKKIMAGILSVATLTASLPMADASINMAVFAADSESSNVFEFENGKLSIYNGVLSYEMGDEINKIPGFSWDNVKTLYIGSNAEIGEGAGSVYYPATIWCSKLENIEVSAENSEYTSENGVLYNKDMTEIICYPNCKKDSSFVIPDSVKYISSPVDNEYLKTLVIGENYGLDSENYIGDIFRNDSLPALEEYIVSPQNNILSSSDGVLFNKDKTILCSYPLKKADKIYTVPSTVKNISTVAFARMDRYATEYSLAEGISNDLLEKVIIGSNVVDVGGIACYGYNGERDTISFGSCNHLKSVEVDENNSNYKTIDGVLYSKDMTVLCVYPSAKEETSLNMPTTVKKIYSGAFKKCVQLKDVYYNESETKWSKIEIYSGNDCLKNATIHFSENPTAPTEEPTTPPTEPTEPTETTESTEKNLVGDLNNDNSIDSKDAVLVLKYYAECLAGNASTKIPLEKGDINGDGKIDSKDAVKILKYYAQTMVGYNVNIKDVW